MDQSRRTQEPSRIQPPLPPEGLLGFDAPRDPTLLLIAAAILLVYLLQSFEPRAAALVVENSRLTYPLAWVMLVCALAASVVLHEAGHLIAALLLRFDILGGALGPARFTRFENRWRVHFTGGQWWKASVSAIPRPNSSSWRRDMLLVVAAGPLATLWCGCVALGNLLDLQSSGSAWAAFLAFVTEVNVILFVLGMIPNSPRARAHNDARLFLSLLSGGEDAEHILLYQLLMQMKAQGSRPCFYRQDVIQRLPRARASAEMAALFAQSIADWALDRGDLLSAEAWDRRAASFGQQCTPQFACYPLAHSACFDLFLRNNVRAARNKSLEFDARLLQPEWLRERALAVQALSQGDILEGMGALQRADYSMPRGLPCYEYERELLLRLRRTAKILSEQQIPLPKVP